MALDRGTEIKQDRNPLRDHCDVAVIGGGPAGNNVSTHLAKGGFYVVLLEKAKHPREKVGERINPQFWGYADLTGVSEKIEQDGFIAKVGGLMVWGDISQRGRLRLGYRRTYEDVKGICESQLCQYFGFTSLAALDHLGSEVVNADSIVSTMRFLSLSELELILDASQTTNRYSEMFREMALDAGYLGESEEASTSDKVKILSRLEL